jgi:uncharacterized lipoprotein YddW (UPF0748 family)
MLKTLLKGFDTSSWFRRGLVVTIILMTYRLTEWGAKYANTALDMIANGKTIDLMAVAALIGAVAAAPVAIITLLVNKYVETRNNESNS